MASERTETWDRQQILDVVLRYCQGIDRLDLDLVRSAYHDDAVDHHTGFDGTADEYIAWVGPLLSRFMAGTMHTVGNHRVELFDEEALSETYVSATHWGHDASDPGTTFTTGARYVDHMAFRDGRWAIAERWAIREYVRVDAGRLTPVVPSEEAGPVARRDGSDPVQLLRGRLRREG